MNLRERMKKALFMKQYFVDPFGYNNEHFHQTINGEETWERRADESVSKEFYRGVVQHH